MLFPLFIFLFVFFFFFFFNDTATTEIYTGWYTLSLHDALPISGTTTVQSGSFWHGPLAGWSRLFQRSEEHTSELQSHHPISYAVLCMKKKKRDCSQTTDSKLACLYCLNCIIYIY